MQLIVAALYDIALFNLEVTGENVRAIIVESSRLHSPVLAVGRMISQDISYRGCMFKEGDKALFYTAMANFDPAVCENPFYFMPERKANPLSFGTGIHMCIGMGISLNFSTMVVEHISSHYKLSKVEITDLAEGVAAPGAACFNIWVA